MTLRLTNHSTLLSSNTTATGLAALGYRLAHVYGVRATCQMCGAATATRQDWAQPYHDTVGLNVCACGATSRVGCIA